MSDDLLNQHAAISDLQQAEEIVVDQHKAINEFLAQFLPESRELYNMTNSVEYDQDGKYWHFSCSYVPLFEKIGVTTEKIGKLIFFNSFFAIQTVYSKRGEEFFAQLADLASTCRNLMADFRGKLAQEEMLSHNVHPNKR